MRLTALKLSKFVLTVLECSAQFLYLLDKHIDALILVDNDHVALAELLLVLQKLTICVDQRTLILLIQLLDLLIYSKQNFLLSHDFDRSHTVSLFLGWGMEFHLVQALRLFRMLFDKEILDDC